MASNHGPAALQAVDKLLADKPDRVGHDFSQATRCLALFRDELIEAWRASRSEADRRRMAQVNAVLSVVLGSHYPRGDVPWDHIAKARVELARLV